MDIAFPIVSYLHKELVVDKKESFKAMDAHFLSTQKFATLENLSEKYCDGWLLDYSGRFFVLTNPTVKREWARPFSLLWNAVLTVYDVEIKETVTTGILLEHMFGRAKSVQERDFRSFLQRYDKSTVVSKDLLERWPI